MRYRTKRFLLCTLLLLCGSVTFQFLGCANGEARLIGDTALSSINFCFVFDCQNGAIGGLIDFCTPGQELLEDCP